ncbi:hypothetical protein ACLB2K_029677 [Fragaria x ananassa]
MHDVNTNRAMKPAESEHAEQLEPQIEGAENREDEADIRVPDNKPPQKMGDASVEFIEENRDARRPRAKLWRLFQKV